MTALEQAQGSLARASLDSCVKCTICETQCPVARVTPLFPGPKYVGPQAERLRDGASVDYSLDYCSGCAICTTVCPQGVKIAEINGQARAVMKAQNGVQLRDRIITHSEMEGKLLYIHKRVGFNDRMTEMQSAIGLAELARFDSWNLPARRRNGRLLKAALEKHPLVQFAPVDTKERENAYWMAPFVLRTEKLTCDIKRFKAAVAAEGVPVMGVLWPEMYLECAYTERNGFGVAKYPFCDPKARNIDYTQVLCERARWMTSRTMCFITHPVYTEAHMQACVDAFNKVAKAYMK